ncbi:MAG: hypothetical protein Q8O86_10295 [Dehalococcoidia bacterium]|nr:hypothetical protein [Dehalococcoidia bacterium]
MTLNSSRYKCLLVVLLSSVFTLLAAYTAVPPLVTRPAEERQVLWNTALDLMASVFSVAFASSVPAASAEGVAYIIIHVHNPEGVEIASIQGVDPGSVQIYDGDTLISYGTNNATTHNEPMGILPGAHTIKAVFNGMTKEQTITLSANDTKVVTFTFDRTEFDLLAVLQTARSGSVSISKDLASTAEHPSEWGTEENSGSPFQPALAYYTGWAWGPQGGVGSLYITCRWLC